MADQKKSRITYSFTGDGTRELFPILWPYIDRGFVYVRLQKTRHDEMRDITASCTWITDSQIKITPAPPAGSTITITRRTPYDRPLTVFHDGSNHIARDLNMVSTQVLHAVEEGQDFNESVLNYVEEAEGYLQKLGDLEEALDGAKAQAAAAAKSAHDAALSAGAAEQIVNQGQPDASEITKGITRYGSADDHRTGADGVAAVPKHVLALVQDEVGTVRGDLTEDVNAVAQDLAALDAIVPKPTPDDDQKLVHIDAEGKYVIGPDLPVSPRIRNLILSGREKGGLPAYIVPGYGEFLDMRHESGFLLGETGRVSASSQYDGNYTPEKVLTNQLVHVTHYWHTKSGEATGTWEYRFKKPRVLTGMWMKHLDPNHSPKHWTLEGYNEGTSGWDVLREQNDIKHGPSNGSLVGKEYGTMFWFHHNKTAYKHIRLVVDQSYGTVVQIHAIRFFERAVSTDIGKFDAALVASPEQPFRAAIACGDAGDHRLTVERDVVIPGSILAEMSRNYLYLVPQNKDGSCPSYVNAAKAVHIPEAKAYLVADLRKVNHGSEEALKKQCLLALQCQETTDRETLWSEYIDVGAGGWAHRVYGYGLKTRTAQKMRGSDASWYFGSNSYIYPNQNLYDSYKEKTACVYPGDSDFTIEVDVTYDGPAPEADDTYRVIFDTGYYESKGLAVAYFHRRGHIALYINGAWRYAAPWVADNREHTLAVSKRADKLFIHVDGKCIGFYDACPPVRKHYDQWFIGRWHHTDGNRWIGYINNIRYIIGDCLHQNEDYTVPDVFSTHPIPDKTRWWNARKGVVQEWDVATETWLDTPMLPIGHIDAGGLEHLHTESPTGTYRDWNILGVVPGSFQTNGIYNGTYIAPGIFNFGDNNTYLCPNGTANNTAAYWVAFELTEPVAFGEVRLTKSHGGWLNEPCIFTWEGSEDGENWTMLVDRSTYVRDGSLMNENDRDSWAIHSFKRFPYGNPTRFKFYRITLPPKGHVPFFQGNYTGFRLRLPLYGATPEIATCTSYVIGDTFMYGPVGIVANTEYSFPVPFGGAEFEVGGYVLENTDWQRKKRPIGQMSQYNHNDTVQRQKGEIIYASADAVVIVTGNNAITIHNGSWDNSQSVSAGCSNVNLNLICRRIV